MATEGPNKTRASRFDFFSRVLLQGCHEVKEHVVPRYGSRPTPLLYSFPSFRRRPLLHGPVPGRREGNRGTAIPSWTAVAILMKDLEKLVVIHSFLIIWDMADAPLLHSFPSFRLRSLLHGPVPRRRGTTEEPLPDYTVAPYQTVLRLSP